MIARVGICDYGVGNLRSVERALRVAGAEPVISGDPDVIVGCDGVVLPGVGAFGIAAGMGGSRRICTSRAICRSRSIRCSSSKIRSYSRAFVIAIAICAARVVKVR